MTEELYNKQTKNGEQRIRNCIKYDLGCGYRLVTIRLADRLFIPFIGDHDETDQWFERHKQDIFSPLDPLYHCERRTATEELSEPTPQTENQQEERLDLYEEQLQAKLDEAMLKAVFPGLYNNKPEPFANASAFDMTPNPSQNSLPITKQQQEKHNA